MSWSFFLIVAGLGFEIVALIFVLCLIPDLRGKTWRR